MTTTETNIQTAGPVSKPHPSETVESFKLSRIIRLSSFQIGSAMADILMTSVWNRIMISNFGIPAWPVGLLIAMRYFLFPLSLWAGYQSDKRPFRGLHRTPYIWFGRFLMFLSFPLLGMSLGRLAGDSADFLGWALAIFCFLLFGAGTLFSGSPFLALVRDSAPREKQGLAISTVETVLIAFFPVAAITFGYWLEDYSQSTFWQVLLFTMVVAGFFWFFAIVGIEKPVEETRSQEDRPDFANFKETFKRIWHDKRTRHFFAFLAIGTVAAWAQDNILEPFGAEVFDLPVGQTTRLNAYWQGALVLTLIGSALVQRKRPPEEQTTVARLGLGSMVAGMISLGASAVSGQLGLVMLGLVIFGAGFGLYTFGSFNLMAAMTTDRDAAAYLGLWTVCILVSRGVGISMGSILRDIFLALSQSPELAYAAIFLLAAAGLYAAIRLLSKDEITSFARDAGRIGVDDLPISVMDL